MRKCTKCGVEKEISEFHFKSVKSGKRDRQCRSCVSEYRKKHYENNKDKYIEKAKKNDARYKTRNHKIVLDYLSEHPCVDCGESDPIVLEFDHRDSSEKVATITHMKVKGWSESRLMEEISKCDVRCANCHRRRTAIQLGWWSYMDGEQSG